MGPFLSTSNLLRRPVLYQAAAHRLVQLRIVQLPLPRSLPSPPLSQLLSLGGKVFTPHTIPRQLAADRPGMASQDLRNLVLGKLSMKQLRYEVTFFLRKMTSHRWDSVPKRCFAHWGVASCSFSELPPLGESPLFQCLKQVEEWLAKASSLIDEEHFLLPIAGGDAKYRERVYCYELYHRLRSYWDKDFPYSLCGEVDKRGHPFVKGVNLDNTIPDMLVHVSGRMENLLVLEVKPAKATLAEIVGDLKKLTAYRCDLRDEHDNPANYDSAIFWLYGLPAARWPELCRDIAEKVRSEKDVNLTLVRAFLHEEPYKPAIEVSWQP
jgi:hypothetical protein